jgi:hypothetical protein
LEDLAVRIDAPQLHVVRITFFNQLVFDVSQLSKLIGRTEKLRTLDEAGLSFGHHGVEIRLYPQINPAANRRLLAIGILCRELEWQFSALAQVCNLSLPLLSTVGRLNINTFPFGGAGDWPLDMENTQWAELLQSFSAVGKLHMYEMARCISKALGDLAGAAGITEIFPVLRTISVKYPASCFKDILPDLERFIAARQSSSYPVTINYGISI